MKIGNIVQEPKDNENPKMGLVVDILEDGKAIIKMFDDHNQIRYLEKKWQNIWKVIL
jgi:hypothetical protein